MLLPYLGSKLAGLRQEPGSTARKLFQGTVVVGTLALTVGAFWGRHIKNDLDGTPPTYNVSADGWSGTTDAIPAAPSGSSGKGDPNGSPVEQMAAATGPAGVPTGWSNNSALWSLLQNENGTTRQSIVWDNPRNSRNYVQPFNLIIPNRYGVTMSSSHQEKLIAGLKYVKSQYGSPEKALKHQVKHGGY